MKKNTMYFLLIVAALVLVFGCAGVAEHREPPLWVREQPAIRDGEQIVGYGVAPSRGDAVTAAEADAATQLTQILLRYYDPDAQGVSDQTAGIIEEVAKLRITELGAADSYRVKRPDGATEVYLLVRYRDELIREDVEEVRLQTAAMEENGRIPERVADNDEPDSPGILVQLRRILENVPEFPRERTQVLEEARALALRTLVTVTPREIAMPLGSQLQRSFVLEVLDQHGRTPQAGEQFSVIETSPEVDGQRRVARDRIVTGADGFAEYRPRVPEFSGLTRIHIQPAWLDTVLQQWRAALDNEDHLRSVATLESRLIATATVRVTTEADRIATAVILIDRDIAGNPIAARDAARGALQQFRDHGFQVFPVDLSAAVESALLDRTEPTVSDLYDLLPFDVLASVERVILGTAEIIQFSENDGITVAIEVNATAFDLRRDQQLARVTLEERVTGRDARATLRSAFQSAGRRTARQITPRLP